MSDFSRLVIVTITAAISIYMWIHYQSPTALALALCVLISSVLLAEFLPAYERKKHLPIRKKVVLVTGCDTGIGNLLAQHLDAIGVTVFAGCLNVDGEGPKTLKKEGSDRLRVVQMDVTNDEQVAAVKRQVELSLEETGNKFWGVVNNAGLNLLGEAELCTVEMYNKVFQINSLGTVRTTMAFLPLIRKSKGRVVNVTSVRGLIAHPWHACYNMSKYAGEAFSDTLRLEMKKWGVKVCIIEPGNFGGATGCLDMNRLKADYAQMWEAADDNLRKAYGKKFLDDQLTVLEKSKATACFDLFRIVDDIVDALFAEKPKHRYLVPGGSGWYEIFKVLICLQHWLPTSVMDWLVLRVTEANKILPQEVIEAKNSKQEEEDEDEDIWDINEEEYDYADDKED